MVQHSQQQTAAEMFFVQSRRVTEIHETHGSLRHVQTTVDRGEASRAMHSERMPKVKHLKTKPRRNVRGDRHDGEDVLV